MSTILNVQGETEALLSDKNQNEEDADTISVCQSHVEPHFANAEVVRDVIIGLSDGLTVPFALAAGLAFLKDSRLVVTAGLAGDFQGF